MHAVDHTKGAPHAATRNALQESARIARGAVEPLAGLSAADFDAVVFPGGFGAAKNLSTWAADGAQCAVHADARKNVLRTLHTRDTLECHRCMSHTATGMARGGSLTGARSVCVCSA